MKHSTEEVDFRRELAHLSWQSEPLNISTAVAADSFDEHAFAAGHGRSSGVPRSREQSFAHYGVTRAEVARWLGSQAFVLDQPAGRVSLLEVWTGKALLATTAEKAGGLSVRIGYDWGHDLDRPLDRRCLLALAWYLAPKHIWCSWSCRHLGPWSRYNETLSEELRAYIHQGRQKADADLRLFGDLWEMQWLRGLHCHGENPKSSLAWRHPVFRRLARMGLRWATWDQCATGLRHPDPQDGRPHKKPTSVATTSEGLVRALSPRICRCTVAHAHLGGSYLNIPLTRYAESYNLELCRLISRPC